MGQLLSLEDILKTYKNNSAGLKALLPYSKWFPIEKTVTLSGIIGDLMGDGHLQGDSKWRIDYTSKHLSELERFGNSVYSLFKVKGRPRLCTTNKFSRSYNYGINCKPLARTLFLCGVPSGNKVFKSFFIPKWVFTDKKYFRRFIQRLLSCEGTVWGGRSSGIRLEMWKHQNILDNGFDFFNQISKGLKTHFGIITTNAFTFNSYNKRKDGEITRPVRLHIKRKDSLYKFYKYIGFEDKIKQNKLKDILSKWDELNTAGT